MKYAYINFQNLVRNTYTIHSEFNKVFNCIFTVLKLTTTIFNFLKHNIVMFLFCKLKI